MLEPSLEGWGAFGQVFKGIFPPDVAGAVGYEEWRGMRNGGVSGWRPGPERGRGRLGHYPLAGDGLRVTRPYLYLGRVVLGHQGRDIGQVRVGGRETRQKAGAEIQGAAGGHGAGRFARHLGSRAGRNGQSGEGSQGGLFGFCLR